MEVDAVQNISLFSSTAETVEMISNKSIERKATYNSEKAQQKQLAKEHKTNAKDEKYSQVMTEKAVGNANNRARILGTDAKFKFNEDINRIVITITDKSNNEIIKEIPSEDTQRMLEHIHTLTGMLVDTKA